MEDSRDIILNGNKYTHSEMVKILAEKAKGVISTEEASKLFTETEMILKSCIQKLEKEYGYALTKNINKYGVAPVASVVLSMPMNGLSMFLQHLHGFGKQFGMNLQQETVHMLKSEINKIIDDFEEKILKEKEKNE